MYNVYGGTTSYGTSFDDGREFYSMPVNIASEAPVAQPQYSYPVSTPPSAYQIQPLPGVTPMGYSYGYDGYIAHPSYTPNYVQVSSNQVYNYYQNPVAPPVEQAQTTASNPYAPYTGSGVTVTPSAFQNPYAPYTGGYVQVTPQNPDTLPQYQGGGSPPPSGSPSGGSSGGGGQGPQPQQKQQPPVNIQINTGSPQHPARRSGSGYTGGNTGAIYNPRKQYAGNDYGGAASYGAQYGQGGASAGYNAPSIVPYLLIGGIGVGAYMLLKKHH